MTDAATLRRAYRDRHLPDGATGYFGDDLPLSDLPAVCVKYAGTTLPAPEIADVVEPFMDDHARQFLWRLAAGQFDGLRRIVFCRDDSSALPAYQYATELRRQGRLLGGPEFHLLNLLHTDSAPARRFNARQIAALPTGRPVPDAIPALDAAQAEGRIAGAEALVWRNARRWMGADHAETLTRALATLPAPADAPRIALIGSALDAPDAYTAIEARGRIVCDLTPLGQWRTRGDATDPLHPRIVPASRHREAILQRIEETRCDIAVLQLDAFDDTLGWDMPSIRKALEERGVTVIDLGFRDRRPDAAWCERIAA